MNNFDIIIGNLLLQIGIIADLDTNSKSLKDKNIFRSYFMHGLLIHNPIANTFVIHWDDDVTEMTSGFSLKGKLITVFLSIFYIMFI